MTGRDFKIVSDLIDDLEIIQESEFRVIGYSKKHNLIYHEWLESSLEIDDDIFRSESLNLFKVVEKYRPVLFLVNDKKRKTSISKDTQEFLVVNFQPLYAHPKMRKVALVSNEELSIQGQAESTMEEIEKETISDTAQFSFFMDITQAVDWLGIDKKY